jgi:O-antigen/teichoic acid export membrane protein
MSNSFVKNGIYNTVAGGVRLLLGILAIPLLVSNLGIKEYGLWTLVSSLIGVLSLLEGGFSTTTTFFISQDVSNEDREGLSQTITTAILSVLGLASIGGISLWLGADLITIGFHKLDVSQHLNVVNALKISSLVLFFKLLQQVLVSLIQGLQQYKKTSALNTLQIISQYVGYIAISYLGGKIFELMVWQLIITTVFFVIYIFFVLEAFHPWSIHYVWKNEKSLKVLKYSISVWISNLGGVLFGQVDKILVGYMVDSYTLGIYGVITNICSQINVISAAPVQPILPILTECLAKNDHKELHSHLKKAFQANCLIATYMGSLLMLSGEAILPLILKSSVDDQTLFAYRIGVLIYTVYSLNAVGYYACFAVNLVQHCMAIVMTSGMLSLFFIRIGIEFWGLVGAMIGNCGYLLSLLLGWKSIKKMNILPNEWILWIISPVVSFICLSIFTIKLSNYPFIQRAGQIVFAFCIVLWSKQLVKPKDIV